MARVGEVSVKFTGDSRKFDQATLKAQSGLKKFGDRIKSIGLLGTVTFAALAVGMVKAVDTMTVALRTIRVNTGKTGDALKSLEASFERVLTSVPQSAAVVADVMGNLNTLLGATGKTLESLTTQLLDVSRLMGGDASQNARMFGRLMRQFQVPAEEGSFLLDKLFRISQDTSIAFGRLIRDLTEFGPVLKIANLSVEEGAVLIGRLASAGINFTRVSPALRQAFIKWGKEGKNAREELARIIPRIRDAETKSKAAAIAAEVFGTEVARLVEVVRTGEFTLDGLTVGLDEARGSIKKVSDDTKALDERLSIVGNRFRVLTNDQLGPAIDMLGELLEKMTEPEASIRFWDRIGIAVDVTTLSILAFGEALVAALGLPILLANKMTGAFEDLTDFIAQKLGELEAEMAEIARRIELTRQRLGVPPAPAPSVPGVPAKLSLRRTAPVGPGAGAAIAAPAIIEPAMTEALERVQEILNELGLAYDRISFRVSVFGDAIDKNEEQLRAIEKALDDLSREGVDPNSEAVQRLKQEYEDLQNAIEAAKKKVEKMDAAQKKAEEGQRRLAESIDNIFDSLSRALTESVTGVLRGTRTISDAFRRMGENILLTISEMIIKGGLNRIRNALDDILGGGAAGSRSRGGGFSLSDLFGGIGGFLGGIFGFQKGGLVTKPTLGVVAERGPEVVVPLSKLRGMDPIGITQIFNIDARGAERGVSLEIERRLRDTKAQAIIEAVFAVRDERVRSANYANTFGTKG